MNENQFIPSISHICCIDKFGLIGKGNKMIWSIPEELAYFKETTNDSILIMGNNTFKGLNNKPLPNRIHIIVSNDVKESTDRVYYVNSIEESIELAQVLALKDQVNIFIVGGQSIYNQTYEYINRVYISVIDYSYYNNDILKGEEDLYYYDYEKVLKDFNLTSSNKLEITNYFYSVFTYVFDKKD